MSQSVYYNESDMNFNNEKQLEMLKSLREKVNWDIENERHEFLDQIDPFIIDWEGQLPNLRDIFRKEEIECLLLDSIKYSFANGSCYVEEQFIEFVARSGYKDEPELDEDGKPQLRHTTAVHCAARNDEFEVLHNLFKIYHRFDVNYMDDEGLTHFHVACEYGYDEIVEKFLELGQDPNCLGGSVEPPLHRALKHKRKKVVESLLRHGADPNMPNGAGESPLLVICQQQRDGGDDDDDDDLAQMLFELSDERYRPVRVDARDKMGGTPLHHALHYGLKKEVELLLRRGGADPNSATDNGLSPLHIVCLRDGDDEDLARMFFQINDELHRRVEVDARDRLDSTPLHTAIYYGNKNLVEFLLRRGADANFADKNGSTPLHFVCGREVEDVDLAKRFFEVCDRLNQPVPIESRDNSNNTPLHLALIRGHKKIVELLLRRGAGPNLANEEGETPLHTICQGDNDDDDLATTFFEINDELHVSVLIDAKDKEGRTPLQFAVANLLPRVVDVLLDRGADLSSFVFPASSYFGKDLENDRLDSKPRLTFEAVAVVERLERRGYEPVRDDALTIMQFFAEHGLFADKSSEFEAELPSRGFFRRWALDCFLELTNDRLPILCCEMIIESLTNEDLWHICLAAAGRSS